MNHFSDTAPPVYLILGTYPGASNKLYVVSTGENPVMSTEENLPLMRKAAQSLVDDNIFKSAQIFRVASEVFVSNRPVDG